MHWNDTHTRGRAKRTNTWSDQRWSNLGPKATRRECEARPKKRRQMVHARGVAVQLAAKSDKEISTGHATVPMESQRRNVCTGLLFCETGSLTIHFLTTATSLGSHRTTRGTPQPSQPPHQHPLGGLCIMQYMMAFHATAHHFSVPLEEGLGLGRFALPLEMAFIERLERLELFNDHQTRWYCIMEGVYFDCSATRERSKQIVTEEPVR